MCLALPARVVGLDATAATIEIGGVRHRASTLRCPDVAIGDWVTVAAGSIVRRITPYEAAEIRTILDRAAMPITPDRTDRGRSTS